MQEDEKIAKSENTPASLKLHEEIRNYHNKIYAQARFDSVFRHLASGRLQASARKNDLSAPKLVKNVTWSEDCRFDPEYMHVIFPSGDWLYDVSVDLPKAQKKRKRNPIRDIKLAHRLRSVLAHYEDLPVGTRKNLRNVLVSW